MIKAEECMAQKIVSFEVAKALKEAGYPQIERNITEIGWYNKTGVFTKELPFIWKGDDVFVALAPSYIDAWLWIVRNKKALIDVMTGNTTECCIYNNTGDNHYETITIADPEEAIAKAIDFLVENKLLK